MGNAGKRAVKGRVRTAALLLGAVASCVVAMEATYYATRAVAGRVERSALGNLVSTARLFLKSEVDPRPYIQVLFGRGDTLQLFFDYTDALGDSALRAEMQPQAVAVGFLDILKAIPVEQKIERIRCDDGAITFFLPQADMEEGRAYAETLAGSKAFLRVKVTPGTGGVYLACELPSLAEVPALAGK